MHLDWAFRVLQEGQYFHKFSKCCIAQQQIEYLGHVVSTFGVQPVHVRYLPFNNCRVQPLFELFVGFYRHFIKGYATITAPLIHLLSQDHLVWSPKSTHAFQALQHAVSTALVLCLSDFSLPFTKDTNALGFGMGAVLSQQNHPIAFFSKQFCSMLLQAFTYIRELCAITTAVKK